MSEKTFEQNLEKLHRNCFTGQLLVASRNFHIKIPRVTGYLSLHRQLTELPRLQSKELDALLT